MLHLPGLELRGRWRLRARCQDHNGYSIAKTTFGKLMEIWKAEEVPLKQKLRLYSAAVISIVAFGFETWEMPPKLEASLRGWNTRCLAIITGREHSQEHRHPTFDLIAKLRARRLKWAGQILRSEPEDSLVHQVLVTAARYDLTTDKPRRPLLMGADTYTTCGHTCSGRIASPSNRQEGMGGQSKTDRPLRTQHGSSSSSSHKPTRCKCRGVAERCKGT